MRREKDHGSYDTKKLKNPVIFEKSRKNRKW